MNYFFIVIVLPAASVLALQSQPKGDYGEVCIPCSCPGKDHTACSVNENTGCYCVNGIYRIGLHGVCAVRVLCYADDDTELFGRVSKAPRIPPGPSGIVRSFHLQDNSRNSSSQTHNVEQSPIK
ncbi:hypothetical protein MTO96_015181 [Rhipicephalus appendiculatus]